MPEKTTSPGRASGSDIQMELDRGKIGSGDYEHYIFRLLPHAKDGEMISKRY